MRKATTNGNGKGLLKLYMYLPKGLGTRSVSFRMLRGTNKQSLVLLNGVVDIMKQASMGELLPSMEGAAL
jgi:hypothetical protein